jgi:hypothetical protein
MQLSVLYLRRSRYAPLFNNINIFAIFCNNLVDFQGQNFSQTNSPQNVYDCKYFR